MIRQKFLTALAVVLGGSSALAQDAPSATPVPATSAEVEQLRQQVQTLTEMVQTLQKQVKEQTPATAPSLPENAEPSPLPEAAAASSPAAAPAALPDHGQRRRRCAY